MANTMIKKHQIALFLDTTDGSTSPEFVRVAKSTDLTLSMNPETEDFDYIVDETPTTELKYYKPSISTPLTTYSDDAIFEYVYDKLYNLSVGSESATNALVVYMFDGDATSGWKAWKAPVSLVLQDWNAVDSVITFDISFGGTITQGTATKGSDGKIVFA